MSSLCSGSASRRAVTMSPSSSTIATISSSLRRSSVSVTFAGVAVSRCSARRRSAMVSAIQAATHGGVRAGVQRRAVADRLGVAFGDRRPGGCYEGGVGRGDGGLVEELGDGVAALQAPELPGQAGVERADEDLLAHDDVAGVADLVGEGVLLRVAAAVVGDA